MRSALVVLALAACSSPASEPRYITIGADAVDTARAVTAQHGMQQLAGTRDSVVLAVDPRDLDALTEAMHDAHHRCGGYMVHDSLADALAAPVPERRIDYSIDRGAIVTAVLPDIDRTRIHSTIAELSSMRNRYYQSASGARASVWLRDRWRSFTSRTDVTIELFDHGYEQKSVVMTIPGTSKEVIVIGGHLDSIARGGMSSDAPGADDDASGIATLTEVARVLLAKDFRPTRTIKFIAYAAEEVGLRGSLSIVKEFKKRNIDVVGALQLDMTNYQGSDKDIWVITDFTSPAQNTFLVSLIERYVGATYGFDRCGYACSDHASWHRAGVPASMPFESRSRDMNKQIHTKRDTLELSGNNADHAVKFARLGAAYAIELAKGELGAQATIAKAPEKRSRWKLYAVVLALFAGGVAFARSRSRRR